ncbi:phosphatidate cytidylyltransferase [Rhizobium leguminosarum]|jgi:phosphatidate cytidylyltransferase|uniref:Phosphatidate cytidylyltransferase n=1 Tax=Rhizobium leguminosarum bv. trifolii (strain WSM1325) TaxID=395491 RepID=C6AX03_RHILS|nr:phosphatidate cytidylyltransferase [Rhizobium leguminosarum]ACS56066.1 phosphatidate cytidylyltransferase [Rhizobium leguminosarum bv. trifolii WSM1325]MBY2908045.1 phosphatidate cytidylyltransferase [Rhizobium leguminosarum]MBY2941459.1 phosphatidate cytidylyltransferase [Rhizobium leguminosarum]MBY2947819.1 phosphatidate cytidylyltransferase [Rhizobium leguminosarum]MBY2993839.1 phosphatidate cytidylyltransferase [Rhizobium leguminosarum]
MQRELKLRIVSGLILAAIVLAATWYGGLAFRILAVVIGLLIYYEWSKMTGIARDWVANAVGWIGEAAIAFLVLVGNFEFAAGMLAGVTAVGIALIILQGTSRWLPVGLFYAGATGLSLAAIRSDDGLGLYAMLFVFAVVWATDILAYFVGRALGGPKLAPSISPGKTWSGAIGGAVSAVVAGVVLVHFLLPGAEIIAAGVALVLSVCSQSGDLFESFIKRKFGVKDSSRLIPGHGGVMDRVDGLIFACFSAFLLAGLFSLIKGAGMTSLGAALFGL